MSTQSRVLGFGLVTAALLAGYVSWKTFTWFLKGKERKLGDYSTQYPVEQQADRAWAVITAATKDYGVIHLLANQRFNIMLLGSNEVELNDLAQIIQEHFPNICVSYLISNPKDVSEEHLARIYGVLEPLSIKVLVVQIDEYPDFDHSLNNLDAMTLHELVTVYCVYPSLLLALCDPLLKREERALCLNVVAKQSPLPSTDILNSSRAYHLELARTLKTRQSNVDIAIIEIPRAKIDLFELKQLLKKALSQV